MCIHLFRYIRCLHFVAFSIFNFIPSVFGVEEELYVFRFVFFFVGLIFVFCFVFCLFFVFCFLWEVVYVHGDFRNCYNITDLADTFFLIMNVEIYFIVEFTK